MIRRLCTAAPRPHAAVVAVAVRSFFSKPSASTPAAAPLKEPMSVNLDDLRAGGAVPEPATQPAAEAKGGSVEDGGETHPDFFSQPLANKPVDAEEVEMIKKDIQETIRDDPVVLFIKGTPDAPVCGFSRRSVDILDALGVEFTSFDVLAHPTVRTYVKEVSEWPTIPQLFVRGEFVGGTDIIVEMFDKGDLEDVLVAKNIEHRPVVRKTK